jgi:hypothetical protein
MSIITLEEYKDYSSIKTPNNDPKLESLITFANTFIENYCSISCVPKILSGIKVTSHDGIDFLLPEMPASSVESVTIKGIVLGTEEYIVNLDVGYVEAVISFPTERNAILLDYTTGLVEAPADLKVSAFELVTYFSKGNFSLTRTSSTGESSTSPNPVLVPPHIKLMLDMHKS